MTLVYTCKPAQQSLTWAGNIYNAVSKLIQSALLLLYPGQCQRLAEVGLSSLQDFPGCAITLSACIRVPIEKITLWRASSESETDEGIAKDICPNRESNQSPPV